MSRFTKRKSFHGQEVYDTHFNKFVARGGFISGGEKSVGNKGGNIVHPSPDTVSYFDDFLGDVVADQWNYTEGDTGNSGAVLANGTGGIYRLTISETAATAPSGYAQINHGAFFQWRPKQGNLRMTARVKLSALPSGENVFIGLTDTGAGEMPLRDTGAGVVAAATNAIGFFRGGQASAATGWALTSVNAATARTPVAGDAPTANVYDVLEFEIGDTGGGGDGKIARFYQNGVLKGAISDPVLATRALVPIIAAFTSDTGGFSVDTDYLNVSANRDTGD